MTPTGMISNRVLLVDDDPSILTTMAANLELEGFDVTEARSVTAALAAFAPGRFSVLVTDMRMPGRNGLDLMREVRKLELDLPVVFITAFAHEAVVDSAIAEGAFTVLRKPANVADVIRIVTSAAQRPVVLAIEVPGSGIDHIAAGLERAGVAARAVRGVDDLESVARRIRFDVCVVDADVEGLIDRLVTVLEGSAVRVSVVAALGDDMSKIGAHLSRMAALVRRPVALGEVVKTIARLRGEP